MKHQVIFSLKDKSEKSEKKKNNKKCCLLQFCLALKGFRVDTLFGRILLPQGTTQEITNAFPLVKRAKEKEKKKNMKVYQYALSLLPSQ